jgi:hypothetical protein
MAAGSVAAAAAPEVKMTVADASAEARMASGLRLMITPLERMRIGRCHDSISNWCQTFQFARAKRVAQKRAVVLRSRQARSRHAKICKKFQQSASDWNISLLR